MFLPLLWQEYRVALLYFTIACDTISFIVRGKFMNIYKSSEDYLETILFLKNKNGVVRSIDIANELNFTKPSVSIAMKKLRENDYIAVDENGFITLSDKGLEIASRVSQRHEVLTDFLIKLGVTAEVAMADACKIEHDISEESFLSIKKHLATL